MWMREWWRRLSLGEGSGRGLGIFYAVSLCVPLVVLGALALLAVAQSPLESDRRPVPMQARVAEASRARSAVAPVGLLPGPVVVARSTVSGLVTRVRLVAGQVVRSGSVLGSVDGHDLIAYQADEPLFATVGPGSQGPMVRRAQKVLRELGFLRGKPTGVFDAATADAAARLNKKWGQPKKVTVGPEGLVWIGTSPVQAAEVQLEAGARTSSGAEIFKSGVAYVGVSVTENPGVAALGSGPLTLEVNGATTPYVAGSGVVVDREFVDKVAAALSGATGATGTVLAEPTRVGTVPASALVTDSHGTVCLFEDATGPGRTVEPLATGTIAAVDVSPSLIGSKYLVNPREVRDSLDCG